MCCIIEIEAKIRGSPKQQQQKIVIFLGKLCSEVKNRFQVTLLPCLWCYRRQLGPHHSDVFSVSGGSWDSWWQMTEHRPVMQQGHETVALEAGCPPIIPLGWSSVPGQGHSSQGVG